MEDTIISTKIPFNTDAKAFNKYTEIISRFAVHGKNLEEFDKNRMITATTTKEFNWLRKHKDILISLTEIENENYQHSIKLIAFDYDFVQSIWRVDSGQIIFIELSEPPQLCTSELLEGMYSIITTTQLAVFKYTFCVFEL